MKKKTTGADESPNPTAMSDGTDHTVTQGTKDRPPLRPSVRNREVVPATTDYLLHPFMEEVRSDNELMAIAIENGLVPIGLRAFFRIVEAWGLREDEGVSLLGFDHMPTESEIGMDPLKRISHTLGIYRALHTLLPSRRAADGWIKKPNDNPLFGGGSAMEYMLANGLEGIESVRKLLVGVMHNY